MIDFNDFNDFNENISDEMLAAYIDGNATPTEASLIESSLGSNNMLSESLEVANDAITFGNNHDWDIHNGDFGFLELGLPPVIKNDGDLFSLAQSSNIMSDLTHNNGILDDSAFHDSQNDTLWRTDDMSSVDSAISIDNMTPFDDLDVT